MKNRCEICGIENNDGAKCSKCTNLNIEKVTPLKSIFYIFDACLLMFRNKELIKLSIIPILLTTFVLIGFSILVLSFYINGLNNYLPDLEGYGFIYKIIKPLLGAFGLVIVSFISLFLFLPVSSIVCIPFNDILSEKTEKILLGIPNEKLPNSNLFFSIKEGVKLLILKIIIMVLFFPINFIPVIGNILYLILLSLTISIDFLDLIMTRKGYTLSEKIKFIQLNAFSYFTFSLQFLVFFWVPILQILLIPCSAISGTKFFIEAQKNSSDKKIT